MKQNKNELKQNEKFGFILSERLYRKILSTCLTFFVLTGVLQHKMAFAQSAANTPEPTWTDDDWLNASEEEKNKEWIKENNLTGMKETPVPHSKDFTPGSRHPLPPSNLKITIENDKAYLSWDKVKGAECYVIYDSQDGKKYHSRAVPIKDPKILIGYVVTLKSQRPHNLGIASLYLGERSKMTVITIRPEDIVSK